MKLKVKTIHKEGNKPISFHPGGLHESTGTATREKIPFSKRKAALSGPKAKKQEQFAENVLKH